MHTQVARWSLLLLWLLSAGCSEPVPQLRPLPKDAVILAFGDSLTHGTGAAGTSSYPTVLAAAIDRTVINAGIPGEKTPTGLERLPKLLDSRQPQLVLLCHGGNDLLAKRPDATIKANLAAMVRLVRAQGAEVVLIGVPKPRLLLSAAPFYAELAQELGLPYLADTLSDVLGDRQLKADQVHPNAAGYRAIADALADLLRESGALPPR